MITAKDAYGNIKNGSPAIVKVTEAEIKAGNVSPAVRAHVEKDPKFAEFVKKYGLPIVDVAPRAGGKGVVGTITEIFGTGSKEADLATKYVATGKQLNDAIKAKGKNVSIATPFMRGTGTPRKAQ